MADGSTSLGSLSYQVIADLDPLEKRIEAFEAKFREKKLAWSLDLDTTAADSKLAALEQRVLTVQAGANGGGGWGGGGIGGFTQSRASMAYGSGSGYAAAPSGVDESTEDDAAKDPTRGSGARGLRTLMIAHMAMRAVQGAVENYQSMEEINDRLEKSGDPDELEKETLKNLKSQDSGVNGFFRRGLTQFGRLARWGSEREKDVPFLSKIDSWVADSFGPGSEGDVHGNVADAEQKLADSKKQHEREKKELTAGNRLHAMFEREGNELESANDDIAVASAGGGVGSALARINKAYDRKIQQIQKEAEDAEKEAANLPQKAGDAARQTAKDNALRLTEAAAQLRSVARSDILIHESQQDEYREAEALAKGKMLGGDRLGGELDNIRAKKKYELDQIKNSDPDAERKRRIIGEETDNDAALARQRHSLDYIHNDQAVADRIKEMGIGTAAINRGSRNAAGFEGVQRILDSTLREDAAQRELGQGGRARRADNLGIAELQRMQAQLTSATGAQETDARYTNFQDKNSDLADLLKQIRDAIDQLNIRMGN